jgi:hypothetical protein
MLKYFSAVRTDLLFSFTGFILLVTGLIHKEGVCTVLIKNHFASFNGSHLLVFSSLVFFGFALLYFIFLKSDKKLNQLLGILHLLMTSMSFFLFFLMIKNKGITDNSYLDLTDLKTLAGKIILFSAILFTSGQLIFFISIKNSLDASRK